MNFLNPFNMQARIIAAPIQLQETGMTMRAIGFPGAGLMGHGMARNIAVMVLPAVTVAEQAAVPHMVRNNKARRA